MLLALGRARGHLARRAARARAGSGATRKAVGGASDVLTKTGGVAAAVASFDGLASRRALEQLVHILARLANNAANLAEIVKSGAVGKLVALLGDGAAAPELVVQALDCLACVALTSRDLAFVAPAVALALAFFSWQ